MNNSWKIAAKEIWNLYRSYGFHDVQVEIYDPDTFYHKEVISTLPPESDLTMFVEKESQLLELLEYQLPGAWCHFGLYLCARSSGSTVIIYTTEDAVCDWESLLKSLQHHLPASINVRFQPAQVIPLVGAQGSFPPWFNQNQEHLHQPGEGVSISSKGSSLRSQGTIGIFIDLEIKDESNVPGLSPGIHRCAVTCHHVTSLGKHSTMRALDVGFPLVGNIGQHSSRNVRFPGVTDLDDLITELNKQISFAEGDIWNLENPPQDSSTDKERARIMISEAQRRITYFKRQLKFFQHPDREQSIGQVLASTGVRVSQALIDPSCQDDSTCGHDHPLQDSALILLSDQKYIPNTQSSHISLPPHQPQQSLILNTEPLQAGSPVCKLGAASGDTWGLVHRPSYYQRTDYYTAADGTSVKRVTKAKDWKVISRNQPSFSQPGDSGSGVSNTRCSMVAQIHSGLDDGKKFPITFVSEFDQVLSNVQNLIPGPTVTLARPDQGAVMPNPLGFVKPYFDWLFERPGPV